MRLGALDAVVFDFEVIMLGHDEVERWSVSARQLSRY